MSSIINRGQMGENGNDASAEIQSDNMESNITKPVTCVQLERAPRKEIKSAIEFESDLEEEDGAYYNGKIQDDEVEDGGNAVGVKIFLGKNDTEILPFPCNKIPVQDKDDTDVQNEVSGRSSETLLMKKNRKMKITNFFKCQLV